MLSSTLKPKLPKIILLLVAAIAIIAAAIFAVSYYRSRQTDKNQLSIVTTNFITYDFARAVASDQAAIKMLLKPGAEAHNFEPTPEDIIAIQNADLFIYIGGESDAWVSDLLQDNQIDSGKVLRLMDVVELKTEEIIEGMEDSDKESPANTSSQSSSASTPNDQSSSANNPDDKSSTSATDDSKEEEKPETDSEATEAEYDEHIWTSLPNAIKLVQKIAIKLSEIAPENKNAFEANAAAYIQKLSAIDQQIRQVIAAAPHKTLIFADRFPFRYFVDEYGLDYYAAFPGCAEQTEASSATIAFLINQVKSTNLPAILKIELTSDNLAQTIAEATDTKILELSAAHNISQADFDRSLTYAEIMSKNVEILREALN